MPRWLLISLISVAIAVVAIAGVLLFKGTSPAEFAAMIAEGSVVQLREEMRPARPEGPRVIIFALDGVGARAFREVVTSGRMPNVAALMGAASDGENVFATGYAPSDVLSILPSTTYAAWTAVYTGRPVAENGVSGNEWFDRETGRFVAPAPVSVTEHQHALEVYSDSLMHGWVAVPTVFELANVRAYATLVAQHRGADLLIRPDMATFGDLITTFASGLANGGSDWETYGALDRDAVTKTLQAIEDHGVPDLLAVYLPGVDLYTHVAEPALPEQRRYLSEVADPAIGQIIDAYRQAGALDDTYVVFVSDHGHTPVIDDERHALGSGEDGELADVLESVGFRVRPFSLETGEDDFQAVLAYQGAFAYLYLADRSTCPAPGSVCDWRAPPRFEEDVVPVLRAIQRAAADGTGGHKLQGVVDLIFSREPRGVGPAADFEVWDGDGLIAVSEYLRGHPRPDLLDLDERLRGLGAGRYGHRAGDVLVLARSRIDEPVERRYYFSSIFRSWHGSPNRADSEILFAIAHARRSGEDLRARMHAAVGERPSQLSVTPLILDLLGE